MNVNATKAIPPEQLGLAVSEVLMEWAENQEKEFVKAIDAAAEACNKEIKQYLRKGHGLRTGDYRSHFSLDQEWLERHHYKREWFVDEGRHRLTHLLEKGHEIKHRFPDGTERVVGHAEPVNHIKYGRQIAEQVLDERLKGLWGD